MVNEKVQKTLQDMYVLRAGLSFVSQQTDCVKKAKENAESEHAKIADEILFTDKEQCDKGAAKNNSDNKTYSEKLFDELKRKSGFYGESDKFGAWLGTEDSERCLREVLEEERKKKIRKPKYVPYIFLTLLFGIGFIIFAAMNLQACIADDVNVQFFVGLGGGIVCFIALVFSGYMWIEKRGEYIEVYLNGYNKKIKQQNIAYLERAISLLPQAKKQNEDIEKRAKEEFKIAKTKSSAVYKSIKENYGGLLDERDWKYLDLISYYFETGRADTIKEALQLVERETQTQRIIKAVEQSARFIAGAIIQAAESISVQLSAISSQLNNVMLMQKIQLDQNRVLISQGEMRNALIKKSNENSEQLMNDVTYIRNFKI